MRLLDLESDVGSVEVEHQTIAWKINGSETHEQSVVFALVLADGSDAYQTVVSVQQAKQLGAWLSEPLGAIRIGGLEARHERNLVIFSLGQEDHAITPQEARTLVDWLNQL